MAQLTFDDGPGEITGELLDLLAAHRIKATFFLLGSAVEAQPALAARLVSEGHTVGNHSFDHPHLPELELREVEDQLRRTSAAIERACGVTPALFRPPYGDTTPQIEALAQSLGMATMLWDVDSHDYEEPGEQAICDAVLGAGEQDIVLLHDGRWPHWQTLRALRLALG